MNTGPSPFSAHQDVLQVPIPDSLDSKAHLLEELKNRGRAAVQAGNWPDATHLYRKALEVSKSYSDETKNQSEIAILCSNLSLTEAKMHAWDAAFSTALDATVADPSYVKGWWRLGQAQAAQENYKDAIQSFETAVQLEPTNKALQKELLKMKEKQSLKEAKLKENQSNLKKEEAPSPSDKTTTASASKPVKTSATKKESSNGDKMEVEEDTSFTKSEFVKGYKIVNGKKTSYFHNELSEDAKKLIGDIAPKKLEDANALASSETNVKDPNALSAWNQAGTWEEKDISQWAKDTLKSLLLATKYVLPSSSPAPNGLITITKVKAKGHASVASVRGKKRYIYEYDLTVTWKFVHDSTEASGTIQFPDVDGTCALGDGYDVSNFAISTISNQALRPVLETFVHKQGFRDLLHNTIDQWVRTIQETY